ncbi:translocation/assembly module TamB domain-containing protein [Winogradskyella litorisediminis]|uniref:Translocation/assembly module TamB domain-containing protein n=1 Tax=Winogradskyella litorisediminis TaxID=1156618 RepID=A0ABW3N531_9FLAO
MILSIPAVQTKLGKYATNRINEDYKTNINIGKVGLQFNGDVELKEILIKDYKLDTLFRITELNTSILSVSNLMNGKLTFGDIDVQDFVFNLKTYKDATDTNLDIFVDKFEDDNPRQGPSQFLLSSSDISIYNGAFRLIDENRETPKIIEFTDLYANATNFLINGPEVKARFNKFRFKDSRGVAVENLMANFEYALDHMSFNQLNIKTEASNLVGNLRFDYKREDLKNFVDKVNITADFKESYIQLSELNAFYDEFGRNQRADLDVSLSGTLNNLLAKDLKISTTRNTRIFGDVNFKNIFDSSTTGFAIEGNYRSLSSNYNDLTALMPNILGNSVPSILAKVGNFRMSGTSLITNKIVEADLNITTDIGVAKSDLKLTNINDIDDANYVGNIILEDFNIGKLLNDPLVQNTSLNLDVEGSSFKLENLETNVKGTIDYLEYNNYKYTNIVVSGDVGKNIFNGELTAKDPNVTLDFNGLADFSEAERKFDFTADVTYANLRALNFITRDDISEFKGLVNLAVTGSTINNLVGKIDIKNTTYKNQDQLYEFKDFSIISSFDGDVRTIKANSEDIISGQVQGKFKFEEVLKLGENALGSIYTNYKPYEISENQYLDFNFIIYNQIAEIIDKDLKLAPNTRIKGRIESDSKGFDLEFQSPQISYKKYIATNVDLEIDNSNPVYNTFIQIEDFDSSIYNISDFNLINVTRRDTLFVKTEFKGGEQQVDNYDLSFFYTINEANNSVVGFNKSKFKFKGFDWFINEEKNRRNTIEFDKEFRNFTLDDIKINQDDEEILLAGVLRDSTYKNLNLDFNNVQLNKITPRIDSLALGGRVNGKLNLFQENGTYLPKSDVVINQLKVNDYDLGDLKAVVKGNNSLTAYNVDLSLKNDNIKSLDAKGSIDVSNTNPNIDLDVMFEDFPLDPLSPLGEGVISNIRGLVSGDVLVSGSLKNPSIDGELLLDKAGLKIPYLNVDLNFDFDSRVTLKEQRFRFNKVAITDTKYFSKGTIDGTIDHNNFSDWKLDLDLVTQRLLVLDTEESEDQPFYGTGFISGKADIFGYTDNLTIRVDGTTEDDTEFYIPLNDSESFGDNSYIKFLSPEEKVKRAKGEANLQTEIKGLNLEFDLNVTPEALIEIVIDKNSGSTIRGRGEGILGIFINTNGKFEMFGDFAIYEGLYNFKYRGLAEKKFTVAPGGSLVWSGDPLGAEINLKALYRTTTNPSVLLDAPINRSIPVNLEINLTGKLERPEPDFRFEFPTVGSTIKSELDYRLSSKEDRDNQALYLLATGGFAGGIADVNVSGTISERLNGIIGSIFGDGSENFKVGVDLDLAQNNANFDTENRVGVTLQTKLSEKVLINGKVGVPFGGARQTTITGNVQIDWLLNEDGTLRATVFNRENNIQNFGDRIGFTQGIGLTYNVEFDNFKELIRKIFSKKEKDEKTEKPMEKKENEDVTPEFISIKKKQN